jgi:hypothetical protein
MLNSSRPVSGAARRFGVRAQKLDFDLRDDNRAARRARAEPARPDLADVDPSLGALQRADRVFTAVISACLEGFALYAMAHLPPINPEQSSPTETEEKPLVRERRRSIAIVSSSADPEVKQSKPGNHRTKSKSEALSEHSSVAESYRSRSFETDRLGRRRWPTMPWSRIASKWRRWRHEREIAALVADSAEPDDRTLRDIGIPHRSQVERAVRYGRDC